MRDPYIGVLKDCFGHSNIIMPAIGEGLATVSAFARVTAEIGDLPGR